MINLLAQNQIQYDGQLGPQAWIMLATILTIIFGGLAWCFYRALTARTIDSQEQRPDEV